VENFEGQDLGADMGGNFGTETSDDLFATTDDADLIDADADADASADMADDGGGADGGEDT